MARPKKVVVEEAPKKVKKTEPVVADRPLTKKERMERSRGFAK